MGESRVGKAELEALLATVSACRHCPGLPLGPRPVLRLSEGVRLLIISQAPSVAVHETGLPFNDVSGDRLRAWLGLDRAAFYDVATVGFMPMAFCYPGRLPRGGDAPPAPACAPLWHARLRACLPEVALTLLVGKYAQDAYLPDDWRRLDVAGRARRWLAEAGEGRAPALVPMVHPSPRNVRWCQLNPWFEAEMMPLVRGMVRAVREA